VCNRHIALHLEPASRRPRIRPINQSVERADFPVTSAPTLDVGVDDEEQPTSFRLPADGPAPGSISFPSFGPVSTSGHTVEPSQALAPEWDFEFDPGIQDWLNEILEGIPGDDVAPSAAPIVAYEPSPLTLNRTDVNYSALLRRLHGRLQVSVRIR